MGAGWEMDNTRCGVDVCGGVPCAVAADDKATTKLAAICKHMHALH